jgi:hypothetical protein
MVRLKIDNREVTAPDGCTVLDAARTAGFEIPTLCHMDGLPHYSSCMVCMVKDRNRNAFIPSCSALALDDMDIDVSGEEVISMRKKAIELLLTEHRAECEAPCHIVCPGGYDIPLMNRLLAAKKYSEVFELVRSEIGQGGLNCTNCKAYCENACRRKKIDEPVSIRNMRLFIAGELGKSGIEPVIVKKEKTFSSRTGKVEPEELKEWLRECINDLPRNRNIITLAGATEESSACMHCDCRAKSDCRLRDISNVYRLKDPSKVVNSPIAKKININTGLVFENAKCIKCGLCVRAVEDSEAEPGLCFLHRGFVSIISEPLTTEFDQILRTKSNRVVEVCPTGALSFFNDQK